MQSAICLDRACHRIAESQIGLLRNSRETRMRPLVAPQFLTFTPPRPRYNGAKLPLQTFMAMLDAANPRRGKARPTVPIFH